MPDPSLTHVCHTALLPHVPSGRLEQAVKTIARLTKANERLRDEGFSRGRTIDGLRVDLATRDAQLANHRDVVERLHDELANFRRGNAALRSALDVFRKDAREQDASLSTLRDVIEQQAMTIAELREKVDELEVTLDDEEAAMLESNDTFQFQRQKIADLEHANGRLRLEIAEYKSMAMKCLGDAARFEAERDQAAASLARAEAIEAAAKEAARGWQNATHHHECAETMHALVDALRSSPIASPKFDPDGMPTTGDHTHGEFVAWSNARHGSELERKRPHCTHEAALERVTANLVTANSVIANKSKYIDRLAVTIATVAERERRLVTVAGSILARVDRLEPDGLASTQYLGAELTCLRAAYAAYATPEPTPTEGRS